MEETRVGREIAERARMAECQKLLRRLVNRRFRSVPSWLDQWLNSQTMPDRVEDIIECLFDVTSVDELRTRLA